MRQVPWFYRYAFLNLKENLFLEDLARDQVSEFLFVCLPLKIQGATSSRYVPWPLCLSVKERMGEHDANHSCHWEYQWLWPSDC